MTETLLPEWAHRALAIEDVKTELREIRWASMLTDEVVSNGPIVFPTVRSDA